MTTKLKLVNKIIEILPPDDTTTYPRLNFNLVNGTYSVPINTENPDDGSIASSYKIGNFIYYIPKTIGPKPLVLTNSKYKMSNVYPRTYQTMTTVPDLLDTSNVTFMSQMFSKCNSLTSIPQLNTSNVTKMMNMFYKCTNLTTIPQLDTNKVTEMSYMFANCASLPSTFPWTIDCSSISSTYDVENMFQGSSVTNVTLANVSDSIKFYFTSELLKGDNTLTINFV